MSYSIPAYHAKSSHYAPYLTQEHQITKPSKTYLRPPHSTTNNTPPLSKRPARNHVHSTSTSSLSSTPHAPRQKKPLLKYGRLPSSRPVVKQHSYLDEGVINGVSSPLGQVRGEKRAPAGALIASSGGGKPKEAWTDGTCSPPKAHQPTVVQPFRRVFARKPPEGVPLLDLSKLNELDENMTPVELLTSGVPSHRSMISWGMPPMSKRGERDQRPREEPEDMTVQDVTEETERSEGGGERREGGGEKMEVEPLTDMSHFNFVEAKLLSHERSKPASSSTPHSPVNQEPVLFGAGGVAPSRPRAQVFRTHMSLGMGVAESVLNKRIRFEARVLTQNGRDVHRELYGFYFLMDASIAIYEFRQFGKKSSALPLIHRGVYNHQTGHRRGEPFEIREIRKGATLHFRTADHPSLPESLATRPLMAVRITHTDEKAKKELLSRGKTPMECRVVESYLQQPLSPSEEKENNLLQTLQGMMRSRLRGRASKTLVGLGRHLVKMAGDGGGEVGKTALQQALRTFHISLTHEDFDQLWRLLCVGGYEGVSVELCVGALVGGMSEDRRALVRKVFQKLDGHKTGSIHMREIKIFFNPNRHPDVLAGRKTTEEVWFEMFGYLETRGEATIDYTDFEHYYEGVSIETDNDSDFLSLIRNCWNV